MKRAAILGFGFAFGLLLVFGIERFFFSRDYREELPPCLEIGEPYHHRFRANCTGELATPTGTVPFSVNDDGFRDLPRAQILKQRQRVLVAGDSFVEGWWVAADQALPSLLSAALPSKYFINAGLRSTGPVLQSARLKPLLEAYRPQLLLWVLNDTDGLDDRFACAVAKNGGGFGAPEFAMQGWRKGIAELLGNTSAGDRVRRAAYLEEWQRLVDSPAAAGCDACRGVRDFQRLAKAAGVKMFVVYLAKGFPDPGRNYAQARPPRQELLECLAKEGLTPYLAAVEGENYYWEGDFHLNPEGLASLAGALAAQLKEREASGAGKTSR